MKIAVMGTGGLGGYFGGRLVQAGRDVTFIARGPHLQAIRERGLRVQSPDGDFEVKPAQATDNPAEVGPVDLILFCVKAYDAVDAGEQMRPMVGPQTVVIPVLNGIDHIGQLGAILGPEHVLGGIAAYSAHLASPGIIQYGGGGGLIALGEMAGGLSARSEAVAQTLTVEGTEALAVPNIIERMWGKLATLAGVGLCSVVRGNLGVIRSCPETLALAYRARAEAVALAQAQDIALSPVSFEDFGNLLAANADTKPSMLVDLERGHRLEVAALNGAVSRIGKELGVATPVNDFIHACLTPWANGYPTLELIWLC